MQCPECHSPLPDNAAFCYQCGRRLIKRQTYRSRVRTIVSEHKQHSETGMTEQTTCAVETNMPTHDNQQESTDMEHHDELPIQPLSQGTFIANRYEILAFLGYQEQWPVYAVQKHIALHQGNADAFQTRNNSITCWACESVIERAADDYCSECGAELTPPPQWAIQQPAAAEHASALVHDQTGSYVITEDRPEHLSPVAIVQTPLTVSDPTPNFIDAPTMEIMIGEKLTAPPMHPSQLTYSSTEEPEQPTMEFTPPPIDLPEGITAVWQQNDSPTVETMILDTSIEELLMGQIQFRAALASDPGQTRQDKPNEDSSLVMQLSYGGDSTPLPLTVCLVADGLGGHDDGQRAGRLTVRIIAASIINKLWLPTLSGIMGPSFTAQELGNFLRDGIQEANKHLLNLNRAEGGDMGCTITALIAHGEEACIANVGDSRTYHFDGATLAAVTRDHSLVARLVAAEMIAPEDVYTHPQRSQIYRSLGDDPRVEVDLFPFHAVQGETYILCSDGLWEMVHDPAIAQILTHSQSVDPQIIARQFVVAANAFGGEDNISVIVAQVVRA